MSYDSESILAQTTRIKDVREFVQMLGYEKHAIVKFGESSSFEEYLWFDERDYKCWTGVGLAISKSNSGRITVCTYSAAFRSYFDLIHQNRTISLLRRHFGGEFRTSEGRSRYLRHEADPQPAPASGCYLAFMRFGENLIRANVCHESRSFPDDSPVSKKLTKSLLEPDQRGFHPSVIANNTLIPFLVAASEEYLKSTFVVLLRYSTKREGFLKDVRLRGDQLFAIAAGKSSIEDETAESLSFQRIAVVCRHFHDLDPKLDLAGTLRKPYRRRKESLFDSMEDLVLRRHNFIHRARLDISLTDERIDEIINDLEAAITRVHQRINSHYDWSFDKSLGLGGRSRKKELVVPSHGILKLSTR